MFSLEKGNSGPTARAPEHGASPTTAMTHIAIQEALDGEPVAWLEKVTDDQYQGKV